MTEEDVKNRNITPALEAKGWDREHMSMEFPYTAGQIIAKGRVTHRRQRKRCDYVLHTRENYPIAVIEAKLDSHAVSEGIQQAIDYATDLDIHFAYSTNGKGFREHNMLTGEERDLTMDEFPTPDELIERHRREKNITPEVERAESVPFYTDSDSFPPRYYQRIAINKTIEAVARGNKRILLVMATGTGKTYTSFQIIHRLRKAGLARRVLYLADRNILIDQTMRQDFRSLQKVMTKIQGKKPEDGFEVYMSLYGQFVKPEAELPEGGKQPYEENFARDFFDLIVVDECHRSSIKEDAEWHKILEYFEPAVQIGMTATPKSAEGADNLEYFGEPLYTYSLNQGIRDGFLAPYRVTDSYINVDMTGYIPEPDEVDLHGNKITEEIFTRNNFGKDITLQHRQLVVAKRITEMLKMVGRMTKTIVFCPSDEEALLMRDLIASMNEDMMKQNPRYITRITGDDKVGKKLLDDFIDPYTDYPVVATTCQLLTTGVDCKTCGLIVIDKEVGNATTFKQMIGRGTRIFEAKGKYSFDILDFRGATKWFTKGFDQDVDTTKTYGGRRKTTGEYEPEDEGSEGVSEPEDDDVKKFYVEGGEVVITHEQVRHLGSDGKTLHTETLIDYTRKALLAEYSSLDVFVGAWRSADRKREILDELQRKDIYLDLLVEEHPELAGMDEFDIICHLAFDQQPLTRRERLENVKKRNYLARYEGKARDVIEGLMEKYAEVGVRDIEDTQILSIVPFSNIAKRPRIINGIFSGTEDYQGAVRDLEEQIYSVG